MPMEINHAINEPLTTDNEPLTNAFTNQQFRERPIRKGPESPRDYGLKATSLRKEKTKLLSMEMNAPMPSHMLNRNNNQRTSAPAHHRRVVSATLAKNISIETNDRRTTDGEISNTTTTPTWTTRKYIN